MRIKRIASLGLALTLLLILAGCGQKAAKPTTTGSVKYYEGPMRPARSAPTDSVETAAASGRSPRI